MLFWLLSRLIPVFRRNFSQQPILTLWLRLLNQLGLSFLLIICKTHVSLYRAFPTQNSRV